MARDLNVVARPASDRPDLLRPKRRGTPSVDVGGVLVGSAHPIVVQSMTNTDTADAAATATQVASLAAAGSQLVRVTVNTDAAAKALPELSSRLSDLGVGVPIVGDFHYNGHKLLAAYPAAARMLAKYRINPGNVGTKHRDENFQTIVKIAVDNDKPVRIGVNWGSLDQDLLTRLMEENAASPAPTSARAVTIEAIVRSALQSAELAEATGLGHDRILLSAKTSNVRDLIDVYRELGKRCDYPLHLGLTEAGMGAKGIVASASALGVLLNEGIGDTIRVSLTDDPVEEVKVGLTILQALGLRRRGLDLVACPSCGRAEVDVLGLTKRVNEALEREGLKVPIRVAVMGCVVNGPGEAREADLGIAAGKGQGFLIVKGEVKDKIPEERFVEALMEEARRIAAERAAEPDEEEDRKSTRLNSSHT